jgi:hypothetical protein
VAAFQWLAAHDGGAIDDHVRQTLWRDPAVVVEMTTRLRAFARTTADPQARREAEDALRRYGFDDAALAKDDE